MEFWINPKVRRLLSESNARHKVIHSGRGASKTLGAATCILKEVLQNWEVPQRILCVRGTQNKLGESSLQALKTMIFQMEQESFFDITENTLKTNEIIPSEFLFYGARNPIGFKSLEGIDICWIDEATELTDDAWEYLLPTIRKPNSQIWITFNPEFESDPVWQRFIINPPPSTEIISLSYDDNPYFKHLPIYNDMLHDKETNLGLYNWKWLGQFRANPEGALFDPEWIKIEKKNNRVDPKTMDYIVVAIDPSVSADKTSDACGLVVVGRKGEYYYILDDQTMVATPKAWAKQAINLYHKWQANIIVYEKNMGGLLVRETLKTIDKNVPITDVWASRGKIVRAEPVASLYEQGLVLHRKRFPELEYEMTTYTGDPKEKSPNRLDAMVYAVKKCMKKTIDSNLLGVQI